MQDTQPLLVVQFVQLGVQLFHVGGQVASHTGKKAARLLNAAALHGNRDVPLLHNTVAFGGLIEQHTVVFLTVIIAPILLGRHEHFFLKFQRIQPLVDDRDFRDRVRRQRLFQCTILDEHFLFIFLVRYGIIDVGETPAAAELAVYLPDTVPVDTADGNRLLGRFRKAHRSTLFLSSEFLHLCFLAFFIGVCRSCSYRFSLLYSRRPEHRIWVLNIAQSSRSKERPLYLKNPATASGAAQSIHSQLAFSFPMGSLSKK